MHKKNKVFSICVGAIIKNTKNQYLIIKRSAHDSLPGLWELPSGKKEFLESVVNAVIREVMEETGLKIKVLSLANYFEYIMEKELEVRDTLQLNFSCQIVGKSRVVLSIEHSDYAWVDFNTIQKFKLSKSTKNSLLSVMNKM